MKFDILCTDNPVEFNHYIMNIISVHKEGNKFEAYTYPLTDIIKGGIILNTKTTYINNNFYIDRCNAVLGNVNDLYVLILYVPSVEDSFYTNETYFDRSIFKIKHFISKYVDKFNLELSTEYIDTQINEMDISHGRTLQPQYYDNLYIYTSILLVKKIMGSKVYKLIGDFDEVIQHLIQNDTIKDKVLVNMVYNPIRDERTMYVYMDNSTGQK
jgi:hypothetical protein